MVVARRQSGREGFTILELMIVVAILGTLAAIVIPNYIAYRERARYVVAIQDLRLLSSAIDVYSSETGTFPATLNDIGRGGMRDPWGTPYQYLNMDGATIGQMRKDRSLVPVNTDYDLYSMGPDRDSRKPFTARASQDDIVRANNGAYYGRVSDY